MRVDLGRRYIRMPQHFLDRTKIRAMFQQMGGKGMPQGVRLDCFFDIRSTGIILDYRPQTLAADFSA